ncbi:MAG: putative metal-binding motif-containing protein [Sandaracinaceae bacterium]|nr:putative metal-binding motif-containing protein [Sandaracinaceae bacterium]
MACGGTDCDDERPTVHPGAPERCDGLDNDCNGALDAPGEDDDRDGWADLICGGTCVGRCGDCDDTRASVHPGATELCNGRDDDCDGALSPTGEDDDQDGHADAVACAATCTAVCDDCDDTNELVHPGVAPPPDCNGIDDDCDGIADELEVRGGVHIPTGGSSPFDMLFTGSDHLVVHVDFNRGSQDLALTRVSADGQTITHPTTYLTSALTNEIRPDIDWVSPHVAMVYVSDDPDAPGAFYQRIDTNGVVLAGPVRIDGLGTTPALHATIAVAAGADRALVVYSDTTGYYRAIIRPSDGGIVQAGVRFHATGQFEKAWVDWDSVNGVFAAQLAEAQYSSSVYLYRFGLDGAQLGSRVVVDTATNTSHAMVADAGRFVSAWGKGTRRWIVDFDSATGAPLRAAQAVPIPVGHVDREMGIGLTPAHIHMTWEGGMTMRRRSDLGPVSGAYTGGVRSWLAHHIPWAEGRAMIIDAHTTLTIRAMRHVCY